MKFGHKVIEVFVAERILKFTYQNVREKIFKLEITMYSHGARLQLPSYGQSGVRKRAQKPDRDESKSSYKQAEKKLNDQKCTFF